MSIQVSAFRIRLTAAMQTLSSSRYKSLNILTSEAPQLPKGVACQFEVGFFSFGTILDLSNIASLTLQVFASQSDTTVLMEKTLASGSFSATIAEDDWDAGTAQHALFSFTEQETNLAAGTYWLVISGITNAGRVLDYLIADFTIYQDQAGEPTAPAAEPPDVAITLSQAQAIFVAKHGNLSREAQGSDGAFYEYCDDTAKWHKRTLQLVDGAVTRAWDQTGVTNVP